MMPAEWYEYHANALPENATPEDEAKRDFNLSILADKKPYFMTYIYPELRKDYMDYIKSSAKKCRTVFRRSLTSILNARPEDLSEEEATFALYYRKRLPVNDGMCVMNRICRRVEERIDGKLRKHLGDLAMDVSLLKHGSEKHDIRKVEDLRKLYNDYCRYVQERGIRARLLEDAGVNAVRRRMDREMVMDRFRRDAFSVCNNAQDLCDMLVDICYKKEDAKQFLWDICPDGAFRNLLEKHDNKLHYPAQDPDGDIEFNGKRFRMVEKESEVWSNL